MAKYKLSLSAKADSTGRKEIYVRATISRNLRFRFRSGVFVREIFFNEKENSIIVPRRGKLNVLDFDEATKAKQGVEDFRTRLDAVCKSLDGNEELTSDNINSALDATNSMRVEDINFYSISAERKKKREQEEQKVMKSRKKPFFELAEFFLSKNNFSYSHVKAYRVLFRMLARYEGFVSLTDKERKSYILDADTMTREDVEDFFDYVRNERQLSEEYPAIYENLLTKYPVEINTKHRSPKLVDRGENTIKKLQKKLRSFFRWLNEYLLADGLPYTTNNPCKGMVIGSEKNGTPYYLTLEERNAIADYDLPNNKYLERQRDVFIFQCCTGCRVGDLLRLTRDNIINGNLEYMPHKTIGKQPKVVSVPLNERAKSILQKYADYDNKGKLLPFVTAQKYNDAIKEVLTTCGITRMVTILNPKTGEEEQRPINEVASSHMARRTFVGTLYQRLQDPNIIGSMSGHTEGSRAFARYREINDEIKKNAIKMID